MARPARPLRGPGRRPGVYGVEHRACAELLVHPPLGVGHVLDGPVSHGGPRAQEVVGRTEPHPPGRCASPAERRPRRTRAGAATARRHIVGRCPVAALEVLGTHLGAAPQPRQNVTQPPRTFPVRRFRHVLTLAVVVLLTIAAYSVVLRDLLRGYGTTRGARVEHYTLRSRPATATYTIFCVVPARHGNWTLVLIYGRGGGPSGSSARRPSTPCTSSEARAGRAAP